MGNWDAVETTTVVREELSSVITIYTANNRKNKEHEPQTNRSHGWKMNLTWQQAETLLNRLL